MNDQTKTIDQEGNEILDLRKTLMESTLAVDLSRAEFDQAIATAHKYPRVLDTAIKQIETMSCYNLEAAENCIYSLPRGGKPIIGASVGFANILASAWGNCIDGGRPTYTDRKEKAVFAEGVFHDLQTNRRTIIHESRRIVDKQGRLFSDDMIIITAKAAAAIARRNAILNAVPRALWHPIWENALRIVRGDQETFAERKDKAMKAFSQFGVKPEQVMMFLGLKGEADLTLEHIPTLRGMYSALRDGSTTVEELFDPRRMTGRGFEVVENPLGDQAEDVTDGMTDDAAEPVQAEAVQSAQTAAGGAKAQPAAKQQAPAKDELPLNSGTQGPAKTEAKSEPKAESKPEPKPPADAEAYIAHWRAFCASATSAAQVKNQYSAERQLRKNCEPITSDQHEEITQLKDERMAQLSSK